MQKVAHTIPSSWGWQSFEEKCTVQAKHKQTIKNSDTVYGLILPSGTSTGIGIGIVGVWLTEDQMVGRTVWLLLGYVICLFDGKLRNANRLIR